MNTWRVIIVPNSNLFLSVLIPEPHGRRLGLTCAVLKMVPFVPR